jgi:Purple acid Phosphatase, N-terminal domain/Calcineurin-like phosphoesterase
MRVLFALALLPFALAAEDGLISPEQILLRPSFGAGNSATVSVWVSFATPNTTVVKEYIPQVALRKAGASEDTIVTGKTQPTWKCYRDAPRAHWAVLDGLDAGEEYFYSVGNNRFGWSKEHMFRAPVHPKKYGPDGLRAVVYGDMGIEYSWGTVKTLAGWAAKHKLDQILHVGDISYADDRIHIHNGSWYQGILNYFYNMVTEYGSTVPYATTPGNHEMSCDFNDYLGRNPVPWEASQSPSSMFYSFTNQRVRFIATSTEEHLRHPQPENGVLARCVCVCARSPAYHSLPDRSIL